MKKRLCLLLLLVFVLGACSFNKQSSIYDAEVQRLEAAAQFAIILPADWQVYADEQKYFAAVSPQGEIGVSVTAEFAGFAFYSTAELAAKATEHIELEDLRVISESDSLRGKRYTQVLGYTDADGTQGVLYNYVYNPFTSVVYYLFIACAEADYSYYSRQMAEIADSLSPLLTQREYYALIDRLQEEALQDEPLPEE